MVADGEQCIGRVGISYDVETLGTDSVEDVGVTVLVVKRRSRRVPVKQDSKVANQQDSRTPGS